MIQAELSVIGQGCSFPDRLLINQYRYLAPADVLSQGKRDLDFWLSIFA